MTLETILAGVAVTAVVGLVVAGITVWKQVGIHKNDIEHLQAADARIENAIAEIRKDVKFLIKYVKKGD
ncbi:hypothetical protein LCGC14_2029170 [marine sediment metagenome]|uniref:Uncharacterized protein n=1 Tax=marine sediment metagenome TaxID=412755 RepID=A0A0F9EVA5_9ZZZZ